MSDSERVRAEASPAIPGLPRGEPDMAESTSHIASYPIGIFEVASALFVAVHPWSSSIVRAPHAWLEERVELTEAWVAELSNIPKP